MQVRCGRRMDGSGRSLVFSSPKHQPSKLISPVPSNCPTGDDRPPLPPGHPLSWELLTLGTMLEGSPYANCF